MRNWLGKVNGRDVFVTHAHKNVCKFRARV